MQAGLRSIGRRPVRGGFLGARHDVTDCPEDGHRASCSADMADIRQAPQDHPGDGARRHLSSMAGQNRNDNQ